MCAASCLGTVTINAAFLREIKEANAELWILLAEIRRYCEKPMGPCRLRTVLDKLGALRDQLTRHFSLEEAYGYFRDPVEIPSHFTREAQHLHDQHQELALELGQITQRAEELWRHKRDLSVALWIGPRFLAFDERLRKHEDDENELIMDALAIHLGVAG